MLNKIFHAISCAETDGILDATFYDTNYGFSGKKIIGALQRLTSIYEKDASACYLEVGVFRGLTLLSTAMCSPGLSCFGVDNFAFFDPRKENLTHVKDCISKHGLGNVHLVNADFEEALPRLDGHLDKKKVAVYFIDGPHDYRSQLLCLILIQPYLHQNAVIVIDDCNYRHVRLANRDFLLMHPEWKLVFEAYTKCHPHNLKPDASHLAKEGWWNGVNVLIRDKENELAPLFPPTESSRELFYNDHILHSARFAELAPRLLDICQNLNRLNFYRAGKLVLKLLYDYMRNKGEFKKRFGSMNTFSDGLAKSHYASYRSKPVSS